MNNRQIEIKLNNAYWSHNDKAYQEEVASVKMMGFKIMRNSDGDHKVVKKAIGYEFPDAFGDIFGGIFNG